MAVSQQESYSKPSLTPGQKRMAGILNVVVLLLSVLLIVFISVDTFKGIPFLDNHTYMTFQFWVCVIFMAVFFIDMSFARNKWRYIRRRWLFFILSIPVLNIINQFNLNLSAETVYFLRFIPLARGGLAIAIIVGFFTHNRVASVFASYTAILVLVVYFCSLIIFEREQPVNPQIPDYSSALWFSCMVVTTIGCNIAPLTISGKILQIVLSGMGMIMFPLFTVFITSTVIRLRQQRADKIAAMTAASPASSKTAQQSTSSSSDASSADPTSHTTPPEQ